MERGAKELLGVLVEGAGPSAGLKPWAELPNGRKPSNYTFKLTSSVTLAPLGLSLALLRIREMG